MTLADSSILKKQELLLLALVGLLAVLHALLWSQIRDNPLLSVALFAAAMLAGGAYWTWVNFKVVKADPDTRRRISVKIENILHSLFLPRGYDIITLPDIDDDRLIGRAELRDRHGIPVLVQFHEWPMNRQVDEKDLEELDSRMAGKEIPKGICMATTSFTPAALDYARRKNILTKDTDELMEMISQAEDEIHAAAAGESVNCFTCGAKLEPSEEITGLMICMNPDCGKTYSREELEEEQKKQKGPEDFTSFTIDCYECGRPVRLDTNMHGLVECPYDDCSWIINVDNELLTLKGGLDKRYSENLAEIICPRCDKLIKVPADADGLMECPCEEKWIIDVGHVLGLRAQAQSAERLAGDGGEVGHETEDSAAAAEELRDCPVCGAGLPAADQAETTAQTRQPPAVPQPVEAELAAPPGLQLTHRHAYLNLDTGGLLLFAALSVSAFLAFVYLVVR